MQRKKAAATTTATKLLTRTVNLTPQSPSYDISTKTKNSLLSTISLKSPIPEQEEPSHLLSVLEKQQEEKKKSNNFFAGLMQMSKKEEKPIERRPTLMSLMAKGLTDGSLMKAKQEKKMY
nr:unnamed protein product [Naegleria fowleri]